MTLALNMICKDEAPRIARAIRSAAKVCTELVVVDTGSTDGTQQIVRDTAAECGVTLTLVEWPWRDDFGAARNVVVEHTRAPWALVLDADDEIDDENAARIRELAASLTDRHDCVLATYRYAWRPNADGADVCVAEGVLNRFIRTASPCRWQRRVHEFFAVDDERALFAPGIMIDHRGYGKPKSEASMTRRLLELSYAEGDRSTRTLWYLAGECAATGDATRARDLFEAVAGAPDAMPFERYDALRQLYHIAVQRGDLATAIAMTERMLADDRTRPDAYIFRGAMALDGGDHAGAIRLLQHALDLPRPNDGIVTNDLYTWMLRTNLARAYAAIGATGPALHNARIARETHPDASAIDALITTLTESTHP